MPKREPTELRAGDTWQWRREDLAGLYPATTWTLTYVFKNAGGGFTFDADPDGVFFSIDVPADETAAYAAETYGWAAQATNGDERHTVGSGTIVVKPDVFSHPGAALETRTHAQKALDAIEAVLERRASLDQQEYEINGRRLVRMKPAELLELRDYYRAEVSRESSAPGSPRRHTAYVRFGNAF